MGFLPRSTIMYLTQNRPENVLHQLSARMTGNFREILQDRKIFPLCGRTGCHHLDSANRSSQKKSFRCPIRRFERSLTCNISVTFSFVFGSCDQGFHPVWSIGSHLPRLVLEPTTCDYRHSPVITGRMDGTPHGYRLSPGVVGRVEYLTIVT